MLTALLSQHNSQFGLTRTNPSSHVYCTDKETRERMRNLHMKLQQTQKKRDRLKAKLAGAIKSKGVEIDADKC